MRVVILMNSFLSEIRYIISNYAKLLIGLAGVSLAVILFVVANSFIETNRVIAKRNNPFPSNMILTDSHEGDTINKNYYRILEEYMENADTIPFMVKKVIDGDFTLTYIGTSQTDYYVSNQMVYDITLSDGNYYENLNDCIVSKKLYEEIFSDTFIEVMYGDLKIVGTFECDQYMIIMDYKTFSDFFGENSCIINGNIAYIFDQYLFVFPNSRDVKQGVEKLKQFYPFYNEDYYYVYQDKLVEEELSSKALSTFAVNVIFSIMIIFQALSIMSYMIINYRLRKKEYAIRRVYGANVENIRLSLLFNSLISGIAITFVSIAVGNIIAFALDMGLYKVHVPSSFNLILTLFLGITGFLVILNQLVYCFVDKKTVNVLREVR